jgi:hypothetical protein
VLVALEVGVNIGFDEIGDVGHYAAPACEVCETPFLARLSKTTGFEGQPHSPP